ncbi:MAG: hypothetical protein K2K43_06080 [Alistipes sp.]|nr:hypothetical protein [Alistipes sp.]
MKKLFLIFALCFCTSIASAQFIEVVHLKNGNMIRGIITEQIPNQNLKIQTVDGNVFVYTYDEIEKVTKEALVRNLALQTLSPSATSFQPHYELSIDMGYSINVRDYGAGQVNFSTSYGCRIIPYLYVGAGFGFDYYHSADVLGVPIFADFRGYFTKSEVKPFLNFRFGYSVCNIEGLYFSPSIGVNYKKLDIGFGYTYQRVYDTLNIGAITFKIGIRL